MQWLGLSVRSTVPVVGDLGGLVVPSFEYRYVFGLEFDVHASACGLL